MLRRQIKNDLEAFGHYDTKKFIERLKLFHTDELINGKFQEIIDDTIDPKNVDRAVLCTGKIYYDLVEKRDAQDIKNVALIRLEQLYPLPKKQQKIKQKYSKVKEWVCTRRT